MPPEECGEDVVLAANRMPLYWTRQRAEDGHVDDDPLELKSLPVPSPPVMCWICGEGFLHNMALLKHFSKKHGDYAEYRRGCSGEHNKMGSCRFYLR